MEAEHKINCINCYNEHLSIKATYPFPGSYEVKCDRCKAINRGTVNWNSSGEIIISDCSVSSGGVICPKCGQTSYDVQFCEHCGSLLVRFAMQGINLSNTGYLTNDIVFPGLLESLKNNLQRKPVVPWDTHFIKSSRIFIYLSREATHPFMHVRVIRTPTSARLEMGLPFMNAEQRQRFDDIPFSKIIWGDYINFGADAESAARIISDILRNVYQINSIDILTKDCEYLNPDNIFEVIAPSGERNGLFYESDQMRIPREHNEEIQRKKEEESGGWIAIGCITAVIAALLFVIF